MHGAQFPVAIFTVQLLSMSIRNIIFDFGGIFIDIHYHKTREAFIAAGVEDIDAYYQQSYVNPLFAQLETGKISPDAFYDGLREQTGLTLSNETIRNAWNAMLGDFRMSAIASLQQFRERYNVYLLSNTNQIHWEEFSQDYTAQTGGGIFDDEFLHAYYSHDLGLRKPDAICYEQVLQNHGMAASETLFVDDTPKNIIGAQQCGIQTFELKPGLKLEEALAHMIA